MSEGPLRGGDRCTLRDAYAPSLLRLLHPAKYVADAWLCRDELTGMISVQRENSLELFVPLAKAEKRKRSRDQSTAADDARAATPATHLTTQSHPDLGRISPQFLNAAEVVGLPLRPLGER